MSQFNEPYYNGYIKQETEFRFWPSKGIMKIDMGGVEEEFDMRDVFLLHGWLGSMLQHYIDEIKSGKSKHSSQIRKIMKATEEMRKNEQKLLE